MTDELDDDEHELLARIAHRWYVDDRTQSEIAQEFGLSRPKVQRLLRRARSDRRRADPHRGDPWASTSASRRGSSTPSA